MDDTKSRAMGLQPLHQIMDERGWSNHDIVRAAPPGFITHKQVQKARKGRWLTANMRRKIEQAVNACAAPDSYTLEELFTYRGKRKL